MGRQISLFALVTLLFSISIPSAHGVPSSPASHGTSPTAASLVVPSVSGCFIAALSGAREIPSNASTATGTALFILSPNQQQLIYQIEHTVANETVAHVHKGAPDVSGPPITGGTLPGGSPKQGVITLDAQLAADLIAGLLYVNIHSSAFSAGEIRGQILPAGGCFSAALTGAQETPPVTTPATGNTIVALWPDQTKLLYYVEFANLSAAENGAHFHKGAPGVSSPPITGGTLPGGSPKQGVMALDAQLAADLIAGLLYVNIHSTAHGTGEIRGQIMPSAACFTAALSSLNEVANPPISSTATGQGMFVLWSAQKILSYQITHTVGGETAAHIHKAAPGVNGGIIPGGTLPPGMLKEGTLTLSDQDMSDLLAGLLYVNVHSGTHTGGEVRGQIVPGNCQLRLPLIERV